MIRNEHIIEIINVVRDAHKTSAKEMIANHNTTESPFPKNVVIDMDRWILNDLNVFLQSYKKESINNDSQ